MIPKLEPVNAQAKFGTAIVSTNPHKSCHKVLVANFPTSAKDEGLRHKLHLAKP